MDEGTEIVYRGHLDECLKYLADALVKKFPKGSKGTDLAKKPIADFCGITTASVREWFNREIIPIGDTWIRLICYLDLLGFRIIEFERMKKSVHNFLLLIGFGLLSSEEAAKILGYNSAGALFQIFYGKAGISEEKSTKMWDLWKEKKDLLDAKIKEARQKYVLDIELEGFEKTLAVSKEPIVADEANIGQAAKPVAIVDIINALVILLDEKTVEELANRQDPTSIKACQRLLAKMNLLIEKSKGKGGG